MTSSLNIIPYDYQCRKFAQPMLYRVIQLHLTCMEFGVWGLN